MSSTETGIRIKKYNEEIMAHHLPRYHELPDIELYMDQVTALLEKYLGIFFRGDDRIVTSSMINNYVKLGVIPPPVKKRYDRAHIARLIMICMLKQVLGVAGTGELITRRLKSRPIESVYDDFCVRQEKAFSMITDHINAGDVLDEIDYAFEMALLSSAGRAIAVSYTI